MHVDSGGLWRAALLACCGRYGGLHCWLVVDACGVARCRLAPTQLLLMCFNAGWVSVTTVGEAVFRVTSSVSVVVLLSEAAAMRLLNSIIRPVAVAGSACGVCVCVLLGRHGGDAARAIDALRSKDQVSALLWLLGGWAGCVGAAWLGALAGWLCSWGLWPGIDSAERPSADDQP